jgi:hypothetical protein
VLHGRVERSQTTDDLLVACIKAHVEAAGGSWEGRVTPLYQAVNEHARMLAAELPLDFPRSPTAFGWAFRRIGHHGFEAAGLQWRRWRSNGKDRVPMNSFRLSAFGEEGKPGSVV